MITVKLICANCNAVLLEGTADTRAGADLIKSSFHYRRNFIDCGCSSIELATVGFISIDDSNHKGGH